MSANPTPLLEVRGLHSGYGAIPVLRDINFKIFEGDLVAMIGSNGAGKTTLMKTISGLLPPTQGDVLFTGTSIAGKNSAEIVRLGITQTPEGRRIFSGLTVEENLKLGAFARKEQSSESLSADLDKVYGYFPRLNERRNQLAGTMSGGEQQMCAIGRALMGRPRLLMIDELSLGLAPIIVEALLDILAQIHANGTTILLVEQDAATALGFCERAIVLKTGSVDFEGLSENLLSDDSLIGSYLT
jgi:branched-chain amino acid transport system ATP-binding protein